MSAHGVLAAVPKHKLVRDGSIRVVEGLAFDADGFSWTVVAKEFNEWLCKRTDRARFGYYKTAEIKAGAVTALARAGGAK